MNDKFLENAAATESKSNRSQIAKSVMIGLALFLSIMLLLAALVVGLGSITFDESGRLNLTTWLIIEWIGGVIAGVLSGWVSRRKADHFRATVYLSTIIFSAGFLEAVELLRQVFIESIVAPVWIVVSGPFVVAAATMIGGLRLIDNQRTLPKKSKRAFFPDAIRYSSPFLVLAVAALLALFVLPSVAVASGPGIVAVALTADMTIVVPAMFYWLIVRTNRAPWIVIVPVMAVCYAIAFVTIPEHHHSLLDIVRWLLFLIEVAIVVYLINFARRAIAKTAAGELDFSGRIRSAAMQALGSRVVADILATEISILYYAFGRRRSADAPNRFSIHRSVSYFPILMGVIMALVVETTVVHILLSTWSRVAAWIFSGISIYAVIWLLGDFRAIVHRSIQINPTHLVMRIGIRWEANIPHGNIATVRLPQSDERPAGQDVLVATLLRRPNVALRLDHPVEVIGMYGIRRRVKEIWLAVDGLRTFQTELNAARFEQDRQSTNKNQGG